jgi:hypothetical protein
MQAERAQGIPRRDAVGKFPTMIAATFRSEPAPDTLDPPGQAQSRRWTVVLAVVLAAVLAAVLAVVNQHGEDPYCHFIVGIHLAPFGPRKLDAHTVILPRLRRLG